MIRLDVLVFGFKKCTWGLAWRAISPCNHMYVLNGKIDECRHSSVAISRASRGEREHGISAIRRGVVWSNLLGKLTKSRQLSARSWVTDFECSHVAYTRVLRTSKSPHLSSACRHPVSQPRKCLFDERSKEHISPTPSAYPLATRATVLLKIRSVSFGRGRFPISAARFTQPRVALYLFITHFISRHSHRCDVFLSSLLLSFPTLFHI